MQWSPPSVIDTEHWSEELLHAPDAAAFAGLPGRFCMFFQPDADLRTGMLGGCEGLLRWWHPDFGMLRPNPSLRGTRWDDDIADIEEWAVRAVCRQASTWEQLGPGMQVAVNVSGRHLTGEGFIDAVERALDETGIDAAHLAIYVPAGALATDPSHIRRVSRGLAARGVTIVLDGIGGGAEAVDVEDIGATVWKIDLWTAPRRSDRLHPSVTDAVRRARELDIVTVAKAVEDDAALALVRDAGFDRAFGHIVSPALNATAISALVHRSDSTRLLSAPGR